MNTILITGSAKNIDNKCEYDINIWGSLNLQPIQLITTKNIVTTGYTELWELAKEKAVEYFENEQLLDGAYTQYLDHLIIID